MSASTKTARQTETETPDRNSYAGRRAAYLDMFGVEPPELVEEFAALSSLLDRLQYHPQLADGLAEEMGRWIPNLIDRMANPIDRRAQLSTMNGEPGETTLMAAQMAADRGEWRGR